MDVDRLLPDGPLVPPTGKDGTLVRQKHLDDNDTADATHMALREARIQLWRDLWARTEDVDRQITEAVKPLHLENQRLRRTVRNLRRARSCRT